MLPDETDSAVAAWLDSSDTQREIAIARYRLAQLNSTLDPVALALGIEILAALALAPLDETVELPAEMPEMDDDDDDEPWRAR